MGRHRSPHTLLTFAAITFALSSSSLSAQATAHFFPLGATLQARFENDTSWREGVIAIVGDCAAFRPARAPEADSLAAAMGGGIIVQTLPALTSLRVNQGTAQHPSWVDIPSDTLRLLQGCQPTDPSLPTP